jgi:hypothetical protein
MRYPQAFVFVDNNFEIPSVENLLSWSQAKSVYVPGRSPLNMRLEKRIGVVTDIKQYLDKPLRHGHQVLVFHGYKIGPFLTLALGGASQAVLWVDSAEHLKKLRQMRRLSNESWTFFSLLKNASFLHSQVQEWLRDTTGLGLVADGMFDRLFDSLNWRQTFEECERASTVFIALRQHIKAQTRAGIVNRIDLEYQEREAA